MCDSCKYDITSEPFFGCLFCGHLSAPNNICSKCNRLASKAWCGGERSGALERLTNLYKFNYTYAAYRELGDILLARMPILPTETVITYIPTLPSHVRIRGYDHARLLASYIAEKQGLKLENSLERLTSSVQHGSSRKLREEQARRAFKARQNLDTEVPYVIVDDIVTTGSTMKYASLALKSAGIKTVWVASATRQPFDQNSNSM